MWDRVLQTVLQMLQTRGYVVETSFSPEQQAALDTDKKKEFYFQAGTAASALLVHFNNDNKIGIKSIRSLLATMEAEEVWHALCVFVQPPTPFAKRYLVTLQQEQPHIRIEYFYAYELIFDITEHCLVPKHTLLNAAQKHQVLKTYGDHEAKYPKILLTDPMARYLGLQPGDMVHIARKLENQGTVPMYRIASAHQ